MAENELSIIESFRNLTKNIVACFENHLLGENKLSCSELNLLGIICESGKNDKKINVTELANLLKITKSATSQLVAKLEKKGLVKKKISIFDKKINYITLADGVMEEYEKSQKEYNEIVRKVHEKLGENDIKELSRLLDKLSGIIRDIRKDEAVC